MAQKCMFHSGIEVEIANTKQEVAAIKEEEKKQSTLIGNLLVELNKKPTTGKLIGALLVIAGIMMSAITLVYYVHKSGVDRQEAQIQKNADEITKVNKRLDSQFSGIINGLAATQTMIKDRMPEKKQEQKKK